ncbi:histidine kinase [Spongiactinospora sp. TRM90649]|uniref:sensor histidine kinase n=1 Tax=Spongiactinospora sp. TRM90649 TaxID=3031114 RepID=UPI0023F6FBCB|nr:histidine kinase [Spongiactinospora sp. TRM90649]MDF5755287.1 histidine kinase [Spongiactinospora sp. TRM90649]
MVARWAEKAFQPGYGIARQVVLLACLAGDLLFIERQAGPGGWALCLVALAVSTVGRWSPLGAVLAQVVLLGVADVYGVPAMTAMKVLTCVSLFELAVRRSGRQVGVGAAAVALVVCVNLLDELPAALPSAVFRIVVVVGAPLLLGGYVRLTRESAERERRRAAERVLAARAAERTSIARELHDLVAHHVSSMVLRVGVARHLLPEHTDPQVAATFDDLHASGMAALADLRNLVGVLRDPATVTGDPGAEPGDAVSIVDPAGVPAALDAVVERARRDGLDVSARVDPGVAALDALRGIALLRLTQEGLANAARHAGPAARVRLGVTVDDSGAVGVDIADDGPGEGTHGVPEPDPGSSGHGLIGMRERVHLLGGRLDAGPCGAGWRLSAVLPERTAGASPSALLPEGAG